MKRLVSANLSKLEYLSIVRGQNGDIFSLITVHYQIIA